MRRSLEMKVQINHACYMCYLPMPFSRRARFVLANDGERDYSQSVAYGIDYEQGAAFAEEKSRLHCAWRRSNPVKDGLHTLLEPRGRRNPVASSPENNRRGDLGASIAAITSGPTRPIRGPFGC